MKVLKLITAILFIAATATLTAVAQQPRQGAKPAVAQATPAPTVVATAIPAKIAFINTEVFKDEKLGIVRWVNAAKALQREFDPKEKELAALETRIQTLTKELQTLNSSAVVDRKSLAFKQEEIARLQREQKFKKDEGEALFKKRYDEVVGPISADIGKALDVFRKQRGITLLLESSRMVQIGAILSADEATDVTAAFIADYNSRNPAAALTVTPGR